MAFSLAAAMDAIAAQLLAAGVTARAYGWPVKEVSPPCAIVGYPAEIVYDATFRDGSQELTFPVYLLIGPVSDRATRDAVSVALEGTAKVKAALDGSLSGTVSDARVATARIQQVPVGLVDYLSVEYALEVIT